MNAGRELDAPVAEKVMGWVVGEHPEKNGTGQWYVEYGEPVYFHDGVFTCAGSFVPSEEIADAWLVVEKMSELGMSVQVSMQHDRPYCCLVIQHDGEVIGECAETAPLAICLAALKAVGVALVQE